MRAIGGSRRAWGWHPLTAEWAQRIVAVAGVKRGDFVLDVGAGCGSLTAALVRAGARVLAIELHSRRADVLRQRFAGEAVTVIEADACDLLLPHRPFLVVSNPPYGMSSVLLSLLTAPRSRLVAAHLVLQQQFVRKTIAQRHSDRRWVFELGRRLPRNAFTPPPQVNSSVLVVARRRCSPAGAASSGPESR